MGSASTVRSSVLVAIRAGLKYRKNVIVGSFIGHVQLAQVPGRQEPDSEGELNYAYVLGQLEANGYGDWVGCEYKPRGKTEEGLGWLRTFGYWNR